jgi:rod shape-determining protein MreC
MWSLLRYFYRHHVIILFIILEIIAFIFVFSYNTFQRASYLNSSNHISGNIYERYNSVINYFSLSSVNRELANENARLRMALAGTGTDSLEMQESIIIQSGLKGDFNFIVARVINNSVHKQHNYITLDKGSKHGVRPDMGVSTVNGVVGVVINVSESFSRAISLLNLRWNVSARLKRNNYFGSLSWDGKDYQHAQLNEIPFHVELEVGDTIVTSGFSSIFPEGIMLGEVESFGKEGGDNFYNIRVKLFVDFKSLAYVEIIESTKRNEIETLENLNTDGKNLD